MSSIESKDKKLITSLLKRLWPNPLHANVSPSEIAEAISYIFTDQLSPVQTGALLTALHFTGWDSRADVIAECALAMRNAAKTPDLKVLGETISKVGKKQGNYNGGLVSNICGSISKLKCDIVGTGGDSHSTFNVSTTSSIIASSLLMISKHGNRASTSKSGSADLLQAMNPGPTLEAATAESLSQIYSQTNYAFLFAPIFHPGMRYVAAVRKELGWRTIFNLLGPLANPVESLLEARLVGVARRDLGPIFAEALSIAGSRKALVVCGEEELDEISCAGRTYCWRVSETNGEGSPIKIDSFTLEPADFGLPAHALADVSPGLSPEENAGILKKLLSNELPADNPILHFVLQNAAALFVISGICDADESLDEPGAVVLKEEGPGGGRWKEGVRRARWAIESGAALKQWKSYVAATST